MKYTKHGQRLTRDTILKLLSDDSIVAQWLPGSQ